MSLRYMDWTYEVDLVGFKVNEFDLGSGLSPNKFGWA